MSVEAKICGINSVEAGLAAARHGAAWIGFVFYPRSPRHVTVEQVVAIAGALPPDLRKVAVLVDPEDDFLDALLAAAPIDLLQLHGSETPERVSAVRARYDLPVVKALAIGAPEDLEAVAAYEAAADLLLFEAKPPKSSPGALPGGNGLTFDWSLLAGRNWPGPWILSGGLTPENVAEAVRATGARRVDVSSGVEERPGVKDPARIARFLDAVRAL
jgi:phosphoribosylanthranilate isomerase